MPGRLLTILALVLLTVTLLAGCGHKAPSVGMPDAQSPSFPSLPASGPEATTPPESETPTPDGSSEPMPPSAILAAPSTLTILSISVGDVFVLRPGSEEWAKAEVGMSLEIGDSVKSGDGSKAKITFFDGSTIELEAGTQIQVAALDIAADTGTTTILLKQEVGKTISRVTKLTDTASRYEVETPAGIAAVRGSAMMVEVVDGTTWVTCIEGNVWVIANGVELKVPVGRTCMVISGGSPQLLPASGSGPGGGWSITKTVENPPNMNISKVTSNDDGTQPDPEGQGAWEILSGEPVWQGVRKDKNVAVTTVTGVVDKTITFSTGNGYPGYCGSVGLIIQNTATIGSGPMEVTRVDVIIATPAGGSAGDLSVTCTGALDTTSPEIIEAGAEAVGGIHFCIEQSAVQGSTYTIEVVIYFGQPSP
jgi:predicted small lipoprotein YifL